MEEYSNIHHKRIPVTIITGFLGAGKTTFLNNVLKKYPKTRFAIIENEFGELGIDGEMLSNDNIPLYELVNGCICCTLNTDFYRALQNIIDNYQDIDHLLVETTGIADPMHVIDLFFSNEQIRNGFIVNSVICLTDSTLLEENLNMQPEARKQIALSDIVLLNKMDMLMGNDTQHLKNRVFDINPMADVIETSHAQTNGTPLLNTEAYSFPHIEKTTLSYQNLNISLQNLAKDKEQLNGHHQHDIHAEGFVFDECFDQELFNIWISSYIYFNQNSLFRVKGILNFKNSKKRYIFQAVKGSCIFEQGSEWQENESRFSKIVFIGKHLNRKQLEQNLSKLFINQNTVATL